MSKRNYALRCAMCGRMKTSNDKNILAKTAEADGWKRVPLFMDDGEVKKKMPVCPACLNENPTVEMFGLVEAARR